MRNVKLIVRILILLLFVFLIGKSQTKEFLQNRTIKIGVLLPMSGVAAIYGEDSMQGLTIAQIEFEEKYPSLDIELFFEDSFYNPTGAVNGYKKLKELNNIDIIIAAGSHIATPIIPLMEEDKVLELAIWAGAPLYSEEHNLNYRVTLLSDDQVPPLLEYMKEKDLNRLAIMFAQNEFGVSFRETFERIAEEYGVSIVSTEGFSGDARDFRTQLTKIHSTQPDTVFFVGTVNQLAKTLNQSSELGLGVQFLSTTPAEDNQLIEGAGTLADGLVYNYNFDHSSKQSRSFTQKYREKYQEAPNFYAAEAYTSFQLIAEAINACNYHNDVSCWKSYLDKLKDLETVMGEAHINQQGDMKAGEVFLKQVQKGKFIKL